MYLTPRQNEFLSKVVDLYQLAGRPIHYTTIAGNLGISKWSAYDMMKLLEDKGLIISSYDVPEIGKCRGRSSIVFSPTAKGQNLIKELSGIIPEKQEWQKLRVKILENLSKLEGPEYETLLCELLKKNPAQTNPLLYCTDMTTAMLLVIKGFKDKLKGGISIKTILKDTPKMSGKLISLAGLTLGMSLTGLADKTSIAKVLGQTRKFKALVQEMDLKRLKMLEEFMDDAAGILLD